MLINYENMTEDQVEAFVDGFANAGGYIGDIESPFPWCCPFYTEENVEVEGSTPAQWGANYWEKNRISIITNLLNAAENGDDEVAAWLDEHNYTDANVPVFLVNKKGEIDGRTRREVRDMLQLPRFEPWISDKVAQDIDNAGLVDFLFRIDAEKYAAEVKAELSKEED